LGGEEFVLVLEFGYLGFEGVQFGLGFGVMLGQVPGYVGKKIVFQMHANFE